MRPALFSLCFLTLLSGCSSDKFTDSEGGTGEGGSDAGCPHALCDDFDQPNEVPGNIPPWTATSGVLAFAAGKASKQSVEAKGITLGSYLRWSARSGAKGITCSGDVWLEPVMSEGGADTRDRTIAVIEVETILDAGNNGTYLLGVTVNDVNGVAGGAIGPGVLMGWGKSPTLVALQKWVPFKFDAVLQGTTLQLSTQVDTATFGGGVTVPYPVNAFRIDLGAASGMPTVVRWDNVTCDPH